MHRRTAAIGALALGLTLLAAPAASAAPAGVIHVPNDFDHSLSDTRGTGHYQVVGSSLHVWTSDTATPASSENKVAEYVDAGTPLSAVGEPTLHQTGTGTAPGFQLVVDFNGDGSAYGTLVGEPDAYGNDWWASNGTDPTVKANAPVDGGGSGSRYHGTLDQWRGAFPQAVVRAFGFSLGSGVLGDYTISSIDFAGTTYTFAADVVLTSKDQCKNGGWATSHPQTFRNQGDCVSYFASSGGRGRS